MIIGCDVDGVLADFNTAYINLMIQVAGRDNFPPRPFDITCWAYPEDLYGYSKKEVSAAWKEISKSKDFWFQLSPLPGAEEFLVDLYTLNQDVYFLTSRVGDQVKFQTECWLMVHGFPTFPTVLITTHKGDACRILGIDFYIDDKTENCQDVLDKSLYTEGYMLRQPWNREVEDVPILGTVNEFYGIVSGYGK